MGGHSPRVRPTIAFAAALCLAFAAALFPSTALGGDCPHDSTHWYAANWSGAGVRGTRVSATTPVSWYVNGQNSTSDEGAWIINTQNESDSLEAGWFTGYWPYGTHGWFSGLLPYWTKTNGTTGTRGNTYVQAGENYKVSIVSAPGGYADFKLSDGTEYEWGNSYYVQNGWNWAQGEVTTSKQTWMGNGQDGWHASGYYTADGTYFYGWGVQSACQNSPYWDIPQGASAWINGGPLP
jgi:hypothetical protein